jgi:hypothetical protein
VASGISLARREEDMRPRSASGLHSDRLLPFPILLTFLLILAALPPTHALANEDTCDGAIVIQWGETWSYNGDLAGYANDYDPAITPPSCTGHPAAGKDLVLRLDLACGSGVNISYAPQGYDGTIYMVTDCSDVSGTCVDGSDRSGVGEFEAVGVGANQTRTYYIIVDARDPGAGGPFSLHFEWLFMDWPPGACCFPDGHCEYLFADGCSGQVVFLGYRVPCEPNLCAPVSTASTRWGRIKQIYR